MYARKHEGSRRDAHTVSERVINKRFKIKSMNCKVRNMNVLIRNVKIIHYVYVNYTLRGRREKFH